MKKAISVLLCIVMLFAVMPLCTAGAVGAETEPDCLTFLQSGNGENIQASFVQDSMLDLILEEYASIFAYNPESMGEIMEYVKDEFLGFFMISSFGGGIYVPLLIPVVFLRFVIGTCKVIAAGIKK